MEDHWTYYGDNQKEYSPIVVGLFTEDELTNFKAGVQYGYAFHFETNGDSSSISVDEENVVTDFNSVFYLASHIQRRRRNAAPLLYAEKVAFLCYNTRCKALSNRRLTNFKPSFGGV